MRTFQFSDAKSHKFWTIDVNGTSFTVAYGKVGTAGQTTTKTFATPEKAQAEADKLVREKTGKGYRETTPTAPKGDEDGFVLGLIDHPDEPARWSAFADYLAEKGDPRGEFMRVQLALEDESLSPAERKKLGAEEEQLLKANEAGWLGPLAEFTVNAAEEQMYVGNRRVYRAPVAHRFERGWLASLDFGRLTVNQARAYAAAPGARLVRELNVINVEAEDAIDPDGDGSGGEGLDSSYTPGPDVPKDIDPYEDPGLHALTRCPHLAAVRTFRLGEPVGPEDDDGFNCHTSGQVAYHLVKQMPHIEELELYAHRVDANKLFALPMPRLRTLVLYHSNRYPLEKLAANKTLTQLATLRCHPHAFDGEDDEDDGAARAYIRLKHLRAVCRAPQFASLTHLSLRLTDFGDAGAEEIVRSGVLKRLKVLDLQGGCMSDEGAKLLTASPDFRNLEFVNLRSNALTATGVRLVQATGVRCDVRNQHRITSLDAGEFAEYLYDGDIE